MDGRGRELQQVATGTRFWWRVLDAQTPTPPLSRPAAPAYRNAAPFQSAPNFTLQIPRADRRLHAKRRRKSRQGRALAMFSVAVALCGSAAFVALPSTKLSIGYGTDKLVELTSRAIAAAGFGIDQVSVAGQHYALDTDVFDALDLPNVKTFAAFDSAAALKRIERISWVYTAQITRVFPGSLAVQIKERAPAAIWARGDRSYLVDVTGRVLGPVPATHGWILPRLAGEGANIDVPLLLTAIGRNKEIAVQFDHAERISERRWSVVLKHGSRIELAADREVEGLDQVAANSDLRRALAGPPVVVDVRTPGRAVVRPVAPPARTASAQTP